MEKFLAQHIFSTFMWAIADLILIPRSGNRCTSKVDPPDEDKLELDTQNPKWSILSLADNTIKDMTKAVEATGLGSSEDAYLLIIPPLSFFYKLPNDCVVDMVRKKAQDNQFGWRDTACGRYARLLDMCKMFSSDSIFVYKIVSTVVSFLVTATSASTSAPAERFFYVDDKALKKSKKALVKTLQKDHAQCLLVLKQVYTSQGLEETFTKHYYWKTIPGCLS
jgi:hypothetical protein